MTDRGEAIGCPLQCSEQAAYSPCIEGLIIWNHKARKVKKQTNDVGELEKVSWLKIIYASWGPWARRGS